MIAGRYKFHRPEHITVVGQRQMGHPQLFCPVRQPHHGNSGVRQGEVGMDVEMDKIGHLPNGSGLEEKWEEGRKVAFHRENRSLLSSFMLY
jgi:hypothetical protein